MTFVYYSGEYRHTFMLLKQRGANAIQADPKPNKQANLQKRSVPNPICNNHKKHWCIMLTWFLSLLYGIHNGHLLHLEWWQASNDFALCWTIPHCLHPMPHNIPLACFSNPFSGIPPPLPSTQTPNVWRHETTVWFNSTQKPTGKQLSGSHVYQGSPPSISPNNHCAITRNHCVRPFTCIHFMVSTPLMIAKAMCHLLSLLDNCRFDIAMWKSSKYNPMFTSGLYYIFHIADPLFIRATSITETTS